MLQKIRKLVKFKSGCDSENDQILRLNNKSEGDAYLHPSTKKKV